MNKVHDDLVKRSLNRNNKPSNPPKRGALSNLPDSKDDATPEQLAAFEKWKRNRNKKNK